MGSSLGGQKELVRRDRAAENRIFTGASCCHFIILAQSDTKQGETIPGAQASDTWWPT